VGDTRVVLVSLTIGTGNFTPLGGVVVVRQCLALLVLTRMRRSIAPGREEGQTLVEYALILVLIAIAVIFAVTFLSGQIEKVFSSISDAPFL